MKGKIIAVAMFLVGGILIASFFLIVFMNVFGNVQDGIVTSLKRVENY